jgi:hypothetical protein
MALWLAASFAQDPKLQHREDAPLTKPAESVTDTVTEVKSPLTLPEDAGGEYVFGKSGEFIEIIFQDGVLRGYMSRESTAENDRGTALTYKFTSTIVDGGRIGFKTARIHDAWYSFDGTILRGASKSLAEDGYYRLAGSLVLHDEGSRTEQHHRVNLKLSRRR